VINLSNISSTHHIDAEEKEMEVIDKETENLDIRKIDLFKTWFIWENFPQTNYNYERMHGMAVGHSFLPISKRLYVNNPEGKKEMMKRESEFFNVHIEFGSVIIGLVVALEEQIAKGIEIPTEFIRSIKTSLMGPLAGVGDTIYQGVLIPILLAIFIDLTLNTQSIWGSIAYFLIMLAISWGFSYINFMFGYNKGADSVMEFLERGILDRIIKGAEIMGCFVMGGLISAYVSIYVPIEIVSSTTTFSIQNDFLDLIMPNILPLLFTLFVYYLLTKKISTNKILLIIVIIGVIGGLTGLFGVAG
jgi:PTS system mannose-specific IID component